MTDAPLSFEAFTAAALEPWFADDQASYAGDSASSPKDAAARAAYQALVVHKIAPHVLLCLHPQSSRWTRDRRFGSLR